MQDRGRLYDITTQRQTSWQDLERKKADATQTTWQKATVNLQDSLCWLEETFINTDAYLSGVTNAFDKYSICHQVYYFSLHKQGSCTEAQCWKEGHIATAHSGQIWLLALPFISAVMSPFSELVCAWTHYTAGRYTQIHIQAHTNNSGQPFTSH